MMTEEELKRFRDYANHYQGSDVFFLMEHIDEQASQIAYWQKCYNDLVELNAKEEGACKMALGAKDRHIAKLTEEIERFYQSSRELGDRKKYKT